MKKLILLLVSLVVFGLDVVRSVLFFLLIGGELALPFQLQFELDLFQFIFELQILLNEFRVPFSFRIPVRY